MENSRCSSPDLIENFEEIENKTIKQLEMVVKNLEIEQSNIITENINYEAELNLAKSRLESKDVEIEKLCKKLLDQDQSYAAASRQAEKDSREREEKLVSKLIQEVREQTDLRIEQERKLGNLEEKCRQLEDELNFYREETSTVLHPYT